MAYSLPLQNNTIFAIQYQLIGWYFDQLVLFFLNSYYAPAFIFADIDSWMSNTGLNKINSFNFCKP